MFAITPLPRGSECAKKNCAACNSMLSKKRNRLLKGKMKKIVFARTWLRLEQALFEKPSMASLKPWIFGTKKKMVLLASSDTAPAVSDDASFPLFLDKFG